MAEYVEKNLERLLPVFESLKETDVLTEPEMREFVKRCRQYEYRISKREKKPADFFKYCEFLTDFLKLVKVRRDAMQKLSAKNEIEQPLKWKVAELYRLCTERFKKLEFFEKELQYLKWARLYGAVSKCYTKMLQTHGHDPKLHEDAARWEFYDNRSAENARSLIQLALRKFPTHIDLWVTFFDVELHYVRTLAERRGFLIKKEDIKQEAATSESDFEPAKKKPKPLPNVDEIPDAVFQFKLAEIVLSNSLEAIPHEQHSRLLFRLWKSAFACLPLTEKVEKLVYDKLWEDEAQEEAYLARILKETAENVSLYTQYDNALEEKPTERMIRLYMEFCENRASVEDPFSNMKLLELLELLHSKSLATEADYTRLVELWDHSDSSTKFEQYLQAALKAYPSVPLFWDHLLILRMKTPEEGDLIKVFEDAISKVKPEASFPIWTKFIDYTIVTSGVPKIIDKVFEKAILVNPPEVSSKIKFIRLEYLKEIFPFDKQKLYKEYERLAKILPNTEKFHLDFVQLELKTKSPNLELIEKAFGNAIAEFGQESLECWLEYAKFLIKYSPEKVGGANSRALANIPSNMADEFHERWTKLVKEA